MIATLTTRRNSEEQLIIRLFDKLAEDGGDQGKSGNSRRPRVKPLAQPDPSLEEHHGQQSHAEENAKPNDKSADGLEGAFRRGVQFMILSYGRPLFGASSARRLFEVRSLEQPSTALSQTAAGVLQISFARRRNGLACVRKEPPRIQVRGYETRLPSIRSVWLDLACNRIQAGANSGASI